MGQGGNGGITLVALDAAAERFGRSALADPTMLGSALRIGDTRLPDAEISALVRAAQSGAAERMRETIEQDVGPTRALAAGIAAADPTADPAATTPARWACTMLGVILGYLPRKWAVDIGELPDGGVARAVGEMTTELPVVSRAAGSVSRAEPTVDLPLRAEPGGGSRAGEPGELVADLPYGGRAAAEEDPLGPTALRSDAPARADEAAEVTVELPVGAERNGDSPTGEPGEPVVDLPYGAGATAAGEVTTGLPLRAEPDGGSRADETYDPGPDEAGEATADLSDRLERDGDSRPGETVELVADLPHGSGASRPREAGELTADLPYHPGEDGPAGVDQAGGATADLPERAEPDSGSRPGEPGELTADPPYRPGPDEPTRADEAAQVTADLPDRAEPAVGSRPGEPGDLVADLPYGAEPSRRGEAGDLTADLPYRAQPVEPGALTADLQDGAEPPRAGEPGDLTVDLPYDARTATAEDPPPPDEPHRVAPDDPPGGLFDDSPYRATKEFQPHDPVADPPDEPPTTPSAGGLFDDSPYRAARQPQPADVPYHAGRPKPVAGELFEADSTAPTVAFPQQAPDRDAGPPAPADPTVEVARPPAAAPPDHADRTDRRRGLLAAALAVVTLAAVGGALSLTFSEQPAPEALPVPVTAMPVPPTSAAPPGANPGGAGVPAPAAAPADPRQAFRNPELLALAAPYVDQPGVTCAETPNLDPNLREHVTCDLGRGWVGIFQEMRTPDLARQVRESYLNGEVLVDPSTVRSLRWKSVTDQPGVKTGIRSGSPDQGEGLRIRFRDQQGKSWLYFDREGTGLQAYLASPDPARTIDDLRTYWVDPSR